MAYQNTDIRGALAYLDDLNIHPASATIRKVRLNNKDNSLILQKVKNLQYAVLLEQLRAKRIRPDVAKLYLKEIYYLNGGKRYFGYGMKNDRGGYEIHNQLFKGAILKSPTTIKGVELDRKRLCVFEGMTDFLSAIQYHNVLALQTDVIILHSATFGKGLIEEIKVS